MSRRLRSILLVVFSIVACAPRGADVEWGEQTPRRMSHEVSGQELDYWLYMPSNSAASASLPLLLFLHGSGERGDDLARVERHGPPALIGREEKLAGFVIVSPQCPENDWWQSDTLAALVREVLDAHQDIDPDRVYVTGLSMGGYGTWSLIVDYPELFAAAVPICGGGEPNRLNPDPDPDLEPTFHIEHLERIREMPIWAFHGEADTVVPVEETKLLVRTLEELGSAVRLTTYSGVGHNCWSRTYARPELYDWLLEQAREEPRDRDQ